MEQESSRWGPLQIICDIDYGGPKIKLSERKSQTPLRVAFFNYSDQSSGAESLINSTVAGLIQRGVEARLYVMDHFTDAPYVHDFPRFPFERRLEYILRRATGRNNIFFPSTAALGSQPWIKEAPIWHFHNLHGHFISIPLLARASRKRLVVLSPVDEFLSTGYCPYTLGCERYRDSCGECPQLSLPYPGLSRDTTPTLLAMKKAAVKKSRFNLLVHTNYLSKHYASTFVGQRPIETINYGIDTQVFRPLDRAACAAALGLKPTPRFVVALLHSYTGEKRKGLLRILEPMQSLADRYPERFSVLIVGHGSELAKEWATENLPITNLPFLSNPHDLAMALNFSDVLLYPTAADNLSLTCLNALACGVPVISSRVGGQPEAIRDGVNGFLCEPGKYDQFMARLAELACDADLHARLSDAARRTVFEYFDVDKYVTNLIGYYQTLLQRENAN